MNVLDENIPDSQRQLLKSWRIQVSQIGHEVGRQGLKDEAIIPLLHKLHSVNFFTRDIGFYRRQLCHPDYCLVCLVVGQYEVASFIRRFLKHPSFNTRAKRMGKVIRLTHMELQVWELHAEKERHIPWLP
ncbi:MAG: hypothetical protein M1147_03300 [Nitrospirae bacterium]|nr:hypothetical protein [Nitrospirota bacterium]